MLFALLVQLTKKTRLSLVQFTIVINIHDNIKLIKYSMNLKKRGGGSTTKKGGFLIKFETNREIYRIQYYL